jgi:hypothetical protein
MRPNRIKILRDRAKADFDVGGPDGFGGIQVRYIRLAQDRFQLGRHISKSVFTECGHRGSRHG